MIAMGSLQHYGSHLEGLPDEILAMIVEPLVSLNNQGLRLHSMPVTAAQPQLRYDIQASLFLASRRLYGACMGVSLRQPLVKVHCWLDGHLHMYYMFPSVCVSDEALAFKFHEATIKIRLAADDADGIWTHAVIDQQLPEMGPWLEGLQCTGSKRAKFQCLSLGHKGAFNDNRCPGVLLSEANVETYLHEFVDLHLQLAWSLSLVTKFNKRAFIRSRTRMVIDQVID